MSEEDGNTEVSLFIHKAIFQASDLLKTFICTLT
jgi:hypothetical protein